MSARISLAIDGAISLSYPSMTALAIYRNAGLFGSVITFANRSLRIMSDGTPRVTFMTSSFSARFIARTRCPGISDSFSENS
ncbi:unknown [Candidatus Colimorpha enterica]|uniref:Uncharacterized protein n=1 Tax=Candidatus Colimorpha enterica TaxID=3083063 RepID=R6V203_9BACT|nr:unknown [Candidatus Colimorpha enterica]